MMEDYRSNPPKIINGSQVVKLLDYEKQVGKNLVNGSTFLLDLPKSNVLQFILEDGSSISARPSGTEPKIKFYFSVNAKLNNATDPIAIGFEEVNKQLDDKIKAVITDISCNCLQ